MTAAQIWSLPAGARAAWLTRNGGACSTHGRRYTVELSDGRCFVGCGLEGDPEPAEVLGRSWPVVLCSVQGSSYSLVTTSIVTTCTETP